MNLKNLKEVNLTRTINSTQWQEPKWSEPSQAATTVSLDNHKPRRDSLIQDAMENLDQGEREAGNENRLNRQVLAKMEVQPLGYPVNHELRVPAHRGMQIGQAIPTPRIAVPENYEALKVNLWTRHANKSMKVILMVGVTERCGVSTTASNFAASLAQQADIKVLLMDANIRSPRRPFFSFKEAEESGPSINLERLLSDPSALRDPAPGSSNLYMLPSGTKCAMPLSIFQSEAFDQFLQKVREFFDYVVIDAPPLAGYPETVLLSRKADGVILVIESEKTRKQSALLAKKQIETAGGKLLGVVLNKRRYRVPSWLYKRA